MDNSNSELNKPEEHQNAGQVPPDELNRLDEAAPADARAAASQWDDLWDDGPEPEPKPRPKLETPKDDLAMLAEQARDREQGRPDGPSAHRRRASTPSAGDSGGGKGIVIAVCIALAVAGGFLRAMTRSSRNERSTVPLPTFEYKGPSGGGSYDSHSKYAHPSPGGSGSNRYTSEDHVKRIMEINENNRRQTEAAARRHTPRTPRTYTPPSPYRSPSRTPTRSPYSSPTRSPHSSPTRSPYSSPMRR
jgi:hypothetical protein